MNSANIESGRPEHFSLMQGGPLYQVYLRSRLAKEPLEWLHRRILALLAICWLPLFALTIVGGTVVGGVELPFLLDFGAQARLLLAIPLLLGGELLAHARLRAIVLQFLERDLIVPDDLPRFESAVRSAIRWRSSALVELLLLVTALTVGFWLWRERIALHVPSWYGTPTPTGGQLTVAGWWYVFVSLTLYRFLSLRWVYRLFVWHRFLWQVSRLSLRLNALHPDRAGGLGFVGQSPFAFAPMLLAGSAVLSGQFADQIRHAGATLPGFKMEIVSFIVIALCAVLVSQVFFMPALARAGRIARRAYGRRASQYVEGFRQKWLVENPANPEEFLGSTDIQSLADLASSYEVASQMRSLPFGKGQLLKLAILTAVPLLPLTLIMIPVDQMLNRLLKLIL